MEVYMLRLSEALRNELNKNNSQDLGHKLILSTLIEVSEHIEEDAYTKTMIDDNIFKDNSIYTINCEYEVKHTDMIDILSWYKDALILEEDSDYIGIIAMRDVIDRVLDLADDNHEACRNLDTFLALLR